jgi:hypothetical protein
MLESFIAFNVNALNYFIYLITSDLSMFLVIAACIGTIVLKVKSEIDTSTYEEQNII